MNWGPVWSSMNDMAIHRGGLFTAYIVVIPF